MPIEGSLRDFTLHDVLQLLHLSGRTGEVIVLKELSGERGSVIFDGGAVVCAGVSGEAPRLGHLLLNAGKITEADLRRAEEMRAADPSRSWREVIRSMDVVSNEELEKFLRFQVEETVYKLLDWREGRFSFAERAIDDSERITWIPPESLLMEGARRADELSVLPAIESSSAVPKLSPRAADGGVLDLTPDEWEVVGGVDGRSEVKSIAWALGRSELAVSKIISRLVLQGLLEVSATEANRTKPPHEAALDVAEALIDQGELDQAHGKIDVILGTHPGEPRAHFLISLLREKSGDLEAAAKGYETTLSFDPLAEHARLRLGLVRAKLGDIEGAADEWTAYLRMTPDSAERRRVERGIRAARELELVLGEFDGRGQEQ